MASLTEPPRHSCFLKKNFFKFSVINTECIVSFRVESSKSSVYVQHPKLSPTAHRSFFQKVDLDHQGRERGMGEQENQTQRLVLESPRSHTPPPFLLPMGPWGEPSSCHFLEGTLDPNLRIQKEPHLGECYRSTELHAKVGAGDCASVRPSVPLRSWTTLAWRQMGQHLSSRATGVQPIPAALALSKVTFYLSFLFSGRLLRCPREQ